jgi:hypothetical protein
MIWNYVSFGKCESHFKLEKAGKVGNHGKFGMEG